MEPEPTTTLVVTINGTDQNRWARYNLRANPFPQIARSEPSAEAANQVLRALDSEPIPDEAELRRRLTGCSPEFIEGCVERYRPGQVVRFAISFPTPQSWR